MTGAEMNWHALEKSAFGMAAAVVASVSMLGLSGCAASFSPATDPQSPLADRVETLVDANRGYPRWENFPAASGAGLTTEQVTERVDGLGRTGSALERQVAAMVWALNDPEAFAIATAARVDPARAAPIAQKSAAEIEEFARELRERGRAPPPVPRY